MKEELGTDAHPHRAAVDAAMVESVCARDDVSREGSIIVGEHGYVPLEFVHYSEDSPLFLKIIS